MEKYRRVLVETPKGKRYLTYRPVNVENATDLICETHCPYKNVCDKIKDPRNLENSELTFLDFCSEIGQEKDDDVEVNMVPVAGTIETELGDVVDIFQAMMEKNPPLRLVQVIDNVCPGWCDDYTPEHKNCNAKNGTCIMKNLFDNTNKKDE